MIPLPTIEHGDRPGWLNGAGPTWNAGTGLMLAGAIALTLGSIGSFLLAGSVNGPSPSGDAHSQDIGSSGQTASNSRELKAPRLPRLRPAYASAEIATVATQDGPATERTDLATWSEPLVGQHAILDDGQAVLACEGVVRNGLPVPASFQRNLPSTGVYRAPGDNAVVSFEADATNGLGFPLALSVQCLFDDGRLARLDVAMR